MNKITFALAIAVGASLSACGGMDAPRPLTCAELASATVPASSIGLPTGGARVTAATPMAAAGSGATAVGAFCRINAEIAPVDLAAPAIKMELNLPETWNGKALMYGGGGLNGSILSTAGTIRLQPTGVAIPLGRGYATFGSDSGHQGASSDGSFALNDEALRNYAYEALKKTRDTAGYLLQLRYGHAPDKVYFHGSSNGGKEALAMIQKFPADIDGAMIFWPGTSLGSILTQFGRISRAMNEPGAWLNIPKRQLVYSAAMAACDTLDGVADNLISNSRQCQQVFDPAAAQYNGKPVRCDGGADLGDTCLSDPQIKLLKTMGTPFVPRYPLASGDTQMPGLNVWGTDLGIKTSDALSTSVTAQGLGTVAPAYPAKANMPFIHIFADQYVKYFVTRDPNATWTTIDPEAPGVRSSRLSQLTGLLDQTKADLSDFQRRGGKVLMVHGMSDQIVPPQATEQYFERVKAAMGADTVRGFMKFYELPGMAHSGNGVAFTPTWDALGALDDWVTKEQSPVNPIVTDIYASPGRTRPMCEYPLYPKYVGGDVEKASSFACSQ